MNFVKKYKFVLIFCFCILFLAGIFFIYKTNNHKISEKNIQGEEKIDAELINNLDLFENYDILANFEFFEDISNEKK